MIQAQARVAPAGVIQMTAFHRASGTAISLAPMVAPPPSTGPV